jgi:hypothetical protein
VHLNDSTSPDKFSLSVDTNNLLETRIDTVWIVARGFPEVKDSILIYQYSGLSPYILMAPREQEISHLGGELPLPFTVTTNHVDDWKFTWTDETGMIDTIIRQDNLLMVSVDSNAMADTRHAEIKAYDPSDSIVFYDIVTVFQGSGSDPYIVVQPAANDTVPSAGDTLTIMTYSNLENYTVERETGQRWYRFVGDSICNLNDTLYLEIDQNQSAYTTRSSYLRFTSPSGDVVKYFYFQQEINSLSIFIEISGNIFVEGDDQYPLPGVSVIIGEDTVVSGQDGKYSKDDVLFGWKGAISPMVSDHFYDPGNYVISAPIFDSIIRDFTAIPINPTVEFSVSEFSVCAGAVLTSESVNYPLPSISGTYGPRSFKWLSDPLDENIFPGDTNILLQPTFAPSDSTKYSLVMYNYGTTDTASFTMNLYPVPEARDFDGPNTVCRNQAGVIYSVSEFDNGEYFSWELSGGGVFITEAKSNIAIIDWGDSEGEFQLSLFTFNQYGCAQDSISKTILVSSSVAPPPSIVEKKQGDNMLLCSDDKANTYQWGWYTMEDGQLGEEYIIPDKNQWYCRLPDEFDPINYKYFVITYYEGLECGSRSFYNPPVGVDEITNENIIVFPNPTDGAINITFNQFGLEPSTMLELYNLSGSLLFQKMLLDVKPNHTISINETGYLKPGIYFIRIRGKDVIYNSKIVVQ